MLFLVLILHHYMGLTRQVGWVSMALTKFGISLIFVKKSRIFMGKPAYFRGRIDKKHDFSGFCRKILGIF